MGPFEMVATCVGEVCFAAILIGVAWAIAYVVKENNR